MKKTMCAWMLAMVGVLAAADQDAALGPVNLAAIHECR